MSYTAQIDGGAIGELKELYYFRADGIEHKIIVHACNASGNSIKTENLTFIAGNGKDFTLKTFQDEVDPPAKEDNIKIGAFDGLGKGLMYWRAVGTEKIESRVFDSSKITNMHLDAGRYDIQIDIMDQENRVVRRFLGRNYEIVGESNMFPEFLFNDSVPVRFDGSTVGVDYIMEKTGDNDWEQYDKLKCGSHSIIIEGMLETYPGKPVAEGTVQTDIYFNPEQRFGDDLVVIRYELKRAADVGTLVVAFDELPVGKNSSYVEIRDSENRSIIKSLDKGRLTRYLPADDYTFMFVAQGDASRPASFRTEGKVEAGKELAISNSSPKKIDINVKGLLDASSLRLVIDGKKEMISLDSSESERTIIRLLSIGEHSIYAETLDADGNVYANCETVIENVSTWSRENIVLELVPVSLDVRNLDIHIGAYPSSVSTYALYRKSGETWNKITEFSDGDMSYSLKLKLDTEYVFRCDALSSSGYVVARCEHTVLMDADKTINFNSYIDTAEVRLTVSGLNGSGAVYSRVDIDGKEGTAERLTGNTEGTFTYEASALKAGKHHVDIYLLDFYGFKTGKTSFDFVLEPGVAYVSKKDNSPVNRVELNFQVLSLLPDQTRTVVTMKSTTETIRRESTGIENIVMRPEIGIYDITVEAYNGDILLGSFRHCDDRWDTSRTLNIRKEMYEGKVEATVKMNSSIAHATSEYSLDEGKTWQPTGEKDGSFVLLLEPGSYHITYRSRDIQGVPVEESGVSLELKAVYPWYEKTMYCNSSLYGLLRLEMSALNGESYYMVSVSNGEPVRVDGKTYSRDVFANQNPASISVDVVGYDSKGIPVSTFHANQQKVYPSKLNTVECNLEKAAVLELQFIIDDSPVVGWSIQSPELDVREIKVSRTRSFLIFRNPGLDRTFIVSGHGADDPYTDISVDTYHRDIEVGFNGVMMITPHPFAEVSLNLDFRGTSVDRIDRYLDGKFVDRISSNFFQKSWRMGQGYHDIEFKLYRKGNLYAEIKENVNVGNNTSISLTPDDIRNTKPFTIQIDGDGVRSVTLDGREIWKGNRRIVCRPTPEVHKIVVDGSAGKVVRTFEVAYGETGGISIDYGTPENTWAFRAHLGYAPVDSEYRAYVDGKRFFYNSSITDNCMEVEVPRTGSSHDIWIGEFRDGKLLEWKLTENVREPSGNSYDMDVRLNNISYGSRLVNVPMKFNHVFNPSSLYEHEELYVDVTRISVELWRFNTRIGNWETERPAGGDFYSSSITIPEIYSGDGYRAHVQLYGSDGRIVADSWHQPVRFDSSGATLDINEAYGEGKLKVELYGHTARPTVLLSGKDVSSEFVKDSRTGAWKAELSAVCGIHDFSVIEDAYRKDMKVRILVAGPQYLELSKMGGGMDMGNDIAKNLTIEIFDSEGRSPSHLDAVYSNQDVVASAKVTNAGDDLVIEWLERGKVIATGASFCMKPQYSGRVFLTARATSGGRIATDTVKYDVNPVTDTIIIYADSDYAGTGIGVYAGTEHQFSAKLYGDAVVAGSDTWTLIAPDGTEKRIGGSAEGEMIPSVSDKIIFDGIGNYRIRYTAVHAGIEKSETLNLKVTMPPTPDIWYSEATPATKEVVGDQMITVTPALYGSIPADGWSLEWWADGVKLDVPASLDVKSEFRPSKAGKYSLSLKGKLEIGSTSMPLVEFFKLEFNVKPVISISQKPVSVYPGEKLTLDYSIVPSSDMERYVTIGGSKAYFNQDGTVDVPYELALRTEPVDIGICLVDERDMIVSTDTARAVQISDSSSLLSLQVKTPIVSANAPISVVLDRRLPNGSVADWYIGQTLYKAGTRGFIDEIYKGEIPYGGYRITALVKDASGNYTGYGYGSIVMNAFAPTLNIERIPDNKLKACFLFSDGVDHGSEIPPGATISWRGSADNWFDDFRNMQWTDLGTGNPISTRSGFYTYEATLRAPDGTEMIARETVEPLISISGNRKLTLSQGAVIGSYALDGDINWDWMTASWNVTGPAKADAVTSDNGKTVEISFTQPGTYDVSVMLVWNGHQISTSRCAVTVEKSVVAVKPKAVWMSQKPEDSRMSASVLVTYSDNSWILDNLVLGDTGYEPSGDTGSGILASDGSMSLVLNGRKVVIPADGGDFMVGSDSFRRIRGQGSSDESLKGRWTVPDIMLGGFAGKYANSAYVYSPGIAAYGKPLVSVSGNPKMLMKVEITDTQMDISRALEGSFRVLDGSLKLPDGFISWMTSSREVSSVDVDRVSFADQPDVNFSTTEDGVKLMLRAYGNRNGVHRNIHVPMVRDNSVIPEPVAFSKPYYAAMGDTLDMMLDIRRASGITDREFWCITGADLSAKTDGSFMDGGKWLLSGNEEFVNKFGADWYVFMGSSVSGTDASASQSRDPEGKVYRNIGTNQEYFDYELLNVQTMKEGNITYWTFDMVLTPMAYGTGASGGDPVVHSGIRAEKVCDDPAVFISEYRALQEKHDPPTIVFNENGIFSFGPYQSSPDGRDNAMGRYSVEESMIRIDMSEGRHDSETMIKTVYLGWDETRKILVHMDQPEVIGIQLKEYKEGAQV